MSAMEWLNKLLGDLDADERRRLLVVLRAALLGAATEEGRSSVHLLAEEVPLLERLEAHALVIVERFAEPQQRDFVDPRYYAAEAWLSDDGAHAVVALAVQALKRLDALLS